VLATAPVDELWLLPTFRHAFGKDLAPYDDRLAMCELVAAELGPRARASRLEAELAARPGFVSSRTVYLLEALARDQPDVAPRLVIGTDILHEHAAWHRWDDVIRLAPPIVVGRGGVRAPAPWAEPPVTMPEVSSTRVRALLAAGGNVDGDLAGLLPRTVIGYIARRQLYRGAP
jgi:nicotinate-nucleotide adenylyltransferase